MNNDLSVSFYYLFGFKGGRHCRMVLNGGLNGLRKEKKKKEQISITIYAPKIVITAIIKNEI